MTSVETGNDPGYHRLPLGLLAAAGFLSISGARVIDPLLTVIAHDFQTTVSAVSVVIAAFTMPYALSQLVLGPAGDRYGKLRVMLGALVGYAVFNALCALSASLSMLTLLRIGAGASSAGLIPICIAYIGDAVPYEARSLTLSRFASGIVVAQILSGPLGGVFGEFVGWRGVFVLLGGLGLGTAGLLAVRLRGLPDRRGQRVFRKDVYRTLLSRADSWQLLVATVAEGGLTGGLFPFLAPYLRNKFHLSYVVIGLVLACFGLGTLCYTRLAKRLLPQLDEGALVLLGALGAAAILAVAVGSGNWLVFIPANVGLGFCYFMMHTVLQSRASELLPSARSTALSLFVFMLFTGQLPVQILTGAAIGAVGYRITLWTAAALLASLGFWLWSHMRRFPSLAQPA
jgi:predicted MFS family arabinose efflux permease